MHTYPRTPAQVGKLLVHPLLASADELVDGALGHGRSDARDPVIHVRLGVRHDPVRAVLALHELAVLDFGGLDHVGVVFAHCFRTDFEQVLCKNKNQIRERERERERERGEKSEKRVKKE